MYAEIKNLGHITKIKGKTAMFFRVDGNCSIQLAGKSVSVSLVFPESEIIDIMSSLNKLLELKPEADRIRSLNKFSKRIMEKASRNDLLKIDRKHLRNRSTSDE